MSKYDEVAGKAAEETDIELSEAITELKGANLGSLFPNPADQKLVERAAPGNAARASGSRSLAL